MSEKQTWYVIDRYSFGKDFPDINPLIVVKETEHTVTVEETGYGRGVRTARRNKDGNMFRTKAEAEAEITRRLSRNIEALQEKLNFAKAAFQKWFVRA
jgi:hypothetical protein